jgi:RNA-directed DNA polymerase
LWDWNARRTPVNTDAPWPGLDEAEARVLGIQTKLHRWATDDPHRRFDDLFNLVYDPAFLTVAWARVRGNRGARSAGVDGVAPRSIVFGKEAFLAGLRDDLKARRFVPLPVREKLIPKKGGKLRGLGIPTARDRTVQAALKLVLEPIFEADFKPCSYGFRPKRRAQDAIEEIFFYATHSYEWVLEGDIKSCFDEIDHTSLMDRVRHRIGDKRVLGLVKAFLKAGILGEDQVERDTVTGTPQGGILSPLLANIALSVLDEHFMGAWASWGGTYERRRRRVKGQATYRLVRYADDFVVLVAGTRDHVEALREEVADVLRPMGLRLSEEKTVITHPHRRGLRLFGLSHPAEAQARRGEAHRVHLPVQVRPGGGQGEGAGAHPRRHEPTARSPAAPAESGAAGLGQLLPARRVQGHLRLPERLQLAAGGQLAAPQTPPCQLEVAPSALPARVATDRRRGHAVQPDGDTGHPLPLPGDTDPHAVDEHR